jgi:vancomycin permeability regulator SanA
MARGPVRRSLIAALALGTAFVGSTNAYVLERGSSHVPDRSTTAGRSGEATLVVLGAGVRPDGAVSTVLRDRLDQAIELWNEGISKKILVSGDHGRDGYDELGPSRAYLVAAGVPDEEIFLDHAGFDTYSTFWRAHRIFGASRVVVVTQAFHLPRALYYARAEGLEADGVAADRHTYPFAMRYAAREVVSRTVAPIYVFFQRKPRAPGGGAGLLATNGHTTHDPHE